MFERGRKRLYVLLGIVALLAGLAGSAGAVFADSPSSGAVYLETNAASGNAVMMYARGAGGMLTFSGSFATGGLGTGAGLGSQGAVALSANRHWLFVVNAGSNEISSFAVQPDGLALVDRVSSGGTTPISLTVRGNFLYALNAGGAGRINGFKVSGQGTLTPIAGSTRLLSNDGAGLAPGPAQVQFSPDGSLLAVTEKGTNLIDTYAVDTNGIPGPRHTDPSAGSTPFGFDFTKTGFLVVSEAGTGSVSSYATNPDGGVVTIAGPVPDTQAAACWLAIGGPARFAYTSNAASHTLSSYSLDQAGALALVQAVAVRLSTDTNAHPLDLAFSRQGDFLYNIDAAVGMIHALQVNSDGSLTKIQDITGVPASSQGIAAQ